MVHTKFRFIWLKGFQMRIKMWKVNGWQTTDAKWWQKHTLPLARWAKSSNFKLHSIDITNQIIPTSLTGCQKGSRFKMGLWVIILYGSFKIKIAKLDFTVKVHVYLPLINPFLCSYIQYLPVILMLQPLISFLYFLIHIFWKKYNILSLFDYDKTRGSTEPVSTTW